MSANGPSQPECECLARGAVLTDLGVLHRVDCAWLAWERTHGGCMGDPDANDGSTAQAEK